jgi:phosphoadenosine phosphosulfate reductase
MRFKLYLLWHNESLYTRTWYETYGERLALSVSFGGAEGMVLLDMVSALTDRVQVITLDTGFLFEETVKFRKEMRRRYRLPVEVIRPSLSVEEQVRRYGPKLHSCSPDLCCQIRKVEPLGRVLEGYDAWMSGIRREQTTHRSAISVVGREERFGVDKISPLASWSKAELYSYIREHNVPLNPLLYRGYKSIGCEPQTRAVSGQESERAGRWPNSEKTECGLHWAGR